jgi:hypothetical protein
MMGGGNTAANSVTKKYLNSKEYVEIKKDLLEQLERNGTVGEYYTDLVNDYMDLWVTKCILVDDIQQRGVTVPWNNGGGQKGRKKNDSVELRIKINAQMLKLLSALGLKATEADGDSNDDEEM